MIGARWRDRIGPPSILLGSALILTVAIPAATAVVSRPSHGLLAACPTTPAKAARAAQRDPSDKAFTVRDDARITPRGELSGRVLRLERGQQRTISFSLPAESFVAERAGNALVYTRAGGGAGSEVHVVDVQTGCDTIVARPREIVRSAILDPAATAVYVHSVTRAGRNDAGVERHDLISGTVTTALPALTASSAIGPIFGTELRWSTDSLSLTVQSCGFARCLSRIVDVGSGVTATVAEHGQGALIATTHDQLITFATCPGLPCAVVAFDIESGASSTLADAAYDARLATRSDGMSVLHVISADGPSEVQL